MINGSQIRELRGISAIGDSAGLAIDETSKANAEVAEERRGRRETNSLFKDRFVGEARRHSFATIIQLETSVRSLLLFSASLALAFEVRFSVLKFSRHLPI
jgi:hypothetical protein